MEKIDYTLALLFFAFVLHVGGSLKKNYKNFIQIEILNNAQGRYAYQRYTSNISLFAAR